MTHSVENGAPPEDRPCYRCGKNPAEGFASIWSAATGERWYCHGDGDESPTCYEAAQRPRVIPPGAETDQFDAEQHTTRTLPPAKTKGDS